MFLWTQIFEKVKAKRAAEQAAVPEEPIKVTLPDGKVMDGVRGKTSPYDIAMTISKGLAESSVVAKVDDVLWDMKRPLDGRVLAKKVTISTRLAFIF
jgi:threonyl-tRNA synthetase